MASRPSAKCRTASSRRTSVRMRRNVVPSCSGLRCRVRALIRSRGASCLSWGWPSESSCARNRRTASVVASAFGSFAISKLDYFPLRASSGLFLGADSNYSWVRYESNQTHEHVDPNIVGLGPRVGYRLNFGKHFYLSPWVSVDYQFNAKDVTISGKTFHENR